MKKVNYFVLFICVLIAIFFLFVGYRTLEFILFYPNRVDGDKSYHRKLVGKYYLDVGDSTLVKTQTVRRVPKGSTDVK
jgi:hypothetical protein